MVGQNDSSAARSLRFSDVTAGLAAVHAYIADFVSSCVPQSDKLTLTNVGRKIGSAVAVLILLGACGGPGSTTVQLEVTGPPGNTLPCTIVIAGEAPSSCSVASFPWASKKFRLKVGTYVSFSIASILTYPEVVTCVLTSDGRIVATASGSEGTLAVCAGKV